MKKQIFITTDFDRIDKSRWPQYVKNFLADPQVSAIHRIAPKIFVDKFNTGSFPRIIFYEEIDEKGNALYVARKYLSKHEEYDQFNDLDLKVKQTKFKYSLSERIEIDEQFRRFVQVEPKPKLPEKMRNWFHLRGYSNKGQSYVFEMEDYCKHFKDKKFEHNKIAIFEHIYKVVGKHEYEEDEDGWIVENFAENKSIVMRIHNMDDHAYFYLFDLDSDVNLTYLKKKYKDLSPAKLLRQARKGYPDWILLVDFPVWIALENDEDSNLALSDEEVDVLNTTAYPFFINGLAGSGKSTILHYLFADAFFESISSPKDLLFVSYSRKLVNKANTIVKALLKTGNKRIDENFKLTDEMEKKLEKCFSPFQNYLIDNILNTEDELKRFSSERHLTFDRFQADYEDNKKCNLPNKARYNAVMVWSVIRTFIKGRDQHSSFNVEQYRDLPKNDRTVSEEDYEAIYQIWKRWYRNYYNEYWDDLDLVRYVLNKIDDNEIPVKKYDVIFCDEAQDFTPVEIRLIIRLSKYSDYDLSEFENIPITFAGDPNQTVIPTGFSWRRLKDIFDRSFDDTVGRNVSLIEKSLNNNYRSKKTIVKFANSIQFIRKCFLSDDALAPQEIWNEQANPIPAIFIINPDEDNLSVTAGFEKADCVITGEEKEYDFSKEDGGFVGDGDKADNILVNIQNKSKINTAKDAKGREFRSVILYKFANQLPESFNKLLDDNPYLSEAERYELSHFFTKLYIAVTRAKEVIYIIDTQDNYDRFWKHFIDNEFVQRLILRRMESEPWKDKVCGVEIGKEKEYFDRLNDNFDPAETARTLMEEAMFAEDPKLMRKAADYYNEAAYMNEADVCCAYVTLFERKFREAGTKFMRLGMIPEAQKAFWRGLIWDEISKGPFGVLEKMTAEYVKGRKSLMQFVKINGLIDKIKYEDETWKKVIMKLGVDIEGEMAEEDIFTLTGFIEQLVGIGFTFLSPKIADIFFRNGRYDKAIQYWDKIGDTKHSRYYEAKEHTSGTTSEKIEWMDKGAKGREIIKNYSDPALIKPLELNDNAIRIIFGHLLSQATFDKALEYPYVAKDKNKRLYDTDPQQFVQKVVLKDFTEEQFVDWVEAPVKRDDLRLFGDKTTKEFLESIFWLYEAKDWMMFMKLTDNDGNRVMSYYIDHTKLADVINIVLPQRGFYKPMASCFLDVLFNNPDYNYANAAKYAKTIVNVFANNDFHVADFRLVTKRNRYFDICGLTGTEVDFIKDHLRDFAEKRITSYKKIKEKDFDEIMTLCHIVEKVAPFVQDEKSGRFVYDLQTVLDFYKRMVCLDQAPEKLKDFFRIRSLIVEMKHKTRMSFKKLSENIKDKFTLEQLLRTFDREDALWFVKLILGGSRFSKENMGKLALKVAELVYKHDFVLKEFEEKSPNVSLNSLIMANHEISKLLEGNRIDVYALKLYTYLWEVMTTKVDVTATDEQNKKRTNEKIANKYDQLAKTKRLEKLYTLVDYLRRRALFHYAFAGKKFFDRKTKEYEINYDIDTVKDWDRPRIEDNADKVVSKPTIINISKDTVVGGINIELQIRRKTIWFSKDGIDLVTVEKGKITKNHDSVNVIGSTFSIGSEFRVNVLSDSQCIISFNHSIYEIKM